MLDGMSDSIQGSRVENLHSREVDRQSRTGLIFIVQHQPRVNSDKMPQNTMLVVVTMLQTCCDGRLRFLPV